MVSEEEEEMKIIIGLWTLMMLAAVCMAQQPSAAPQVSDADREGITRAALDYAESYYEGDGAKMERALHPDLAKRIVRNSPEGRSRLDHMSAMTLVQIIRMGSGKNTPKDQQLKDVKILDVFGNNASARVEMLDWVDYMHLAKWNGQWKIVNVLWEMKKK
jgi:hypothetical protein